MSQGAAALSAKRLKIFYCGIQVHAVYFTTELQQSPETDLPLNRARRLKKTFNKMTKKKKN